LIGKEGLPADGGENGLSLSKCFCWGSNRLGLDEIHNALTHAEAVSKKLYSELAVSAPPHDRHVNGEGHTVLWEIHLQGKVRSRLYRHVALQSASRRREIEQDACSCAGITLDAG
jgi:hypothetical protein